MRTKKIQQNFEKPCPKGLHKPKSFYYTQKSFKVHLMALMDMEAYI
jgi:hypothetical protein